MKKIYTTPRMCVQCLYSSDIITNSGILSGNEGEGLILDFGDKSGWTQIE